jgi:hypothetical protein
VFTARYALNPYIKQIRFVFKGLIYWGAAICLSQHTGLLLSCWLRNTAATSLLTVLIICYHIFGCTNFQKGMIKENKFYNIWTKIKYLILQINSAVINIEAESNKERKKFSVPFLFIWRFTQSFCFLIGMLMTISQFVGTWIYGNNRNCMT